MSEEQVVEQQQAESADASDEDIDSINLQTVYDIPLEVSAILGRAQIKVVKLVSLSRGAVIELDTKVGDPIDICINGRQVAKGEILLVDNKIAITLTEISINEN
jgi:flagellar motor switch protein FliN/FliY